MGSHGEVQNLPWTLPGKSWIYPLKFGGVFQPLKGKWIEGHKNGERHNFLGKNIDKFRSIDDFCGFKHV